MSHIVATNFSGTRPNTYRPCACGVGGKLTATLVCPKCLSRISLREHVITPEGVVEGTIWCAHPRCDWEGTAEFRNWERFREIYKDRL